MSDKPQTAVLDVKASKRAAKKTLEKIPASAPVPAPVKAAKKAMQPMKGVPSEDSKEALRAKPEQ